LILAIKFLFALLVQGAKKFDAGKRAPEDAVYNPRSTRPPDQTFQGFNQTIEQKSAILDEMRWTRIVANDMENIPLFLIIAWGSVIAGNDILTLIKVGILSSILF
jgi:glutathione S-transferase